MPIEANKILCPQCNNSIDVSDALYHQLYEKINAEFSTKTAEQQKNINDEKAKLAQLALTLQQQKSDMQVEVEKAVTQRVIDERQKLEKDIKQQVQHEKSAEIEMLMKELNTKRDEVKDLNKARTQIEVMKREQEEMRDKISLEKEKELTEKLAIEKQKIRALADEEGLLKLREREKIIDDLKTQVETMKRKAEQGSMQLQGEIQELELEKILRESFIYDDFKEIQKGKRGADVAQIVRTRQGVTCGKILYESKRAKNFDMNWLPKLREDNLTEKADIMVLVTEVMPEGHTKFFVKDDVWICTLWEAKALATVLRVMLYELHNTRTAVAGKGTKMETLYDYLTGNEFRAQFEAIISGFSELNKGYQDERMKMQKVWKEREKQLERILTNAVNFYASLKGIAGGAIQDIPLLEGKEE